MSELERLAAGSLRVVGPLPGASNRTLLAEVHDRDGSFPAVYKPASGETALWDYPDGTLHRREVAAYEIARALGWPAIPATVLRDGPEGPGAVQTFVEAVPGAHFFSLREERLADFLVFAAFDVLINNGDRKAGHCVLGTDGVVWGIDHGVSLGIAPNLRTVIWEFAGSPLPPALSRDLARVSAGLRDGALGARVAELLSVEEAVAAADRGDQLVRTGRLPEPGPARPFPWPLV